jgi:hypothetical protein
MTRGICLTQVLLDPVSGKKISGDYDKIGERHDGLTGWSRAGGLVRRDAKTGAELGGHRAGLAAVAQRAGRPILMGSAHRKEDRAPAFVSCFHWPPPP